MLLILNQGKKYQIKSFYITNLDNRYTYILNKQYIDPKVEFLDHFDILRTIILSKNEIYKIKISQTSIIPQNVFQCLKFI